MTKKIFTNKLPKRRTQTSWQESIGFNVPFVFNNIKGEVKIIDYKNGKLNIQYLDKPIYTISTANFIACKIGKLVDGIVMGNDFKYNVGDTIIENNINKTIVKRYKEKDKNNVNIKKYIYDCNICGAKGMIGFDKNINKRQCLCCINAQPVLGINTIYDTDSWMIPYIGEECAKTHTHSSSDKVKVTCPICGEKSKKSTNIYSIYTYGKIACEYCSDGVKYPNKFMLDLLEQLDVDFQTEYSPEWINSKRYDFYIPSMNLIIEMDGGFHNKDNNMSGQSKEESQSIDDYKDEQAIIHGIQVIRIDCDYNSIETRFKYIKQNIIDKLDILFNLSIIKWKQCDMFAVSTRVKEACDLWNSGKFNTTGELSKYMKITSIGKYLKIGNKYNWCKYDAEYESCKVIKNNAKNSSKEVEIFKNNISLGIFISSAELQKLSEKLFGVFLYSCEINRVCNGTKSHYKGFNFKYTNCQPNDEIKYKKGKKVKVFKDGNLIGIYESCNELARISEKEFGKKFQISKISNVCTGKRKSHQGFTFEYIEDDLKVAN